MALDPGVYRNVLRVRQAYPFDIACLLMRFYTGMLNIGVVTMLTLSGYSFFAAGLVSSTIALATFLIGPRVSKLIDERGQLIVVPWASTPSIAGLALLVANTALQGPVWPFFLGAILVGCYPSPHAMARARWTFLIHSGRLGADAPALHTMFSYESVLDDMAFIFSPSLSIALAASVHPVAGMVAGGIGFAAGSAILCAASSTAPAPRWSKEKSRRKRRLKEQSPECQAGALAALEADELVSAASSTVSKGRASLFRLSPVVRVLFFIYLFLGAFLGLFDTATVSLAEDLGAPDIASVVLIIQGVMSMSMGVLFGMVRLRRPLPAQLSLAAAAVGIAFGCMLFVRDAVSLALVGLLGAATYAPLLIVANTVCEKAVPQSRLTEAITWMNAGNTFGAALGPSLGGAVIDALGTLASFKVGTVLALGLVATGLLTRGIVKRNLDARKA